MSKFKFSAVNLGCNKNMVDLEFVIWDILKLSWEYEIEYYENPEDKKVEYVIINTCWFLSTSREEAEKTMKFYDELGKKLIILGCYLEVKDDNFLNKLKNYSEINFEMFPKVGEIFIKKQKKEELKKKLQEQKIEEFAQNTDKKQAFIWKSEDTRAYFNSPFWYEYLKIAEWCDNKCTFCIIPQIRWTQKSRPIEDILNEVQIMLDNWISEIIIIAQDTTRYWSDIYSEPRLAELLEKIENIKWDFKFRLLYMYPDNMTLELLSKLKSFKKFIPYFDIPFQHIAPNILKKMNRFYDKKHIENMLDFIKSNFPTNHIRTSFIIWFPGETEADYVELKEFIEKYEFDSVAMFEYHDEPLAASSKLWDKISHKIAIDRVNKLDKIINSIYDKKIREDKWKEFVWYIIWEKWNKIEIRRELKAPEIDETDLISLKSILTKWDIWIGDKVIYINK